MTIPNALTLFRLFLIPLIVVMIDERRFEFAFYVFTLAGCTDALDGFIARRFNQKSVIGAYLDALADKSLIAAGFIALHAVGILPYWLVVLVIFRDLLIVSAVVIAWLLDNPVPIEPLMISKCNTAAQLVGLSCHLASRAFLWHVPLLEQGLRFAIALLTILSVAAYFMRWFRHMAERVG